MIDYRKLAVFPELCYIDGKRCSHLRKETCPGWHRYPNACDATQTLDKYRGIPSHIFYRTSMTKPVAHKPLTLRMQLYCPLNEPVIKMINKARNKIKPWNSSGLQ